MNFSRAKDLLMSPWFSLCAMHREKNLGIFIAVFMQLQHRGLKYYETPREEDMSSSCVLLALTAGGEFYQAVQDLDAAYLSSLIAGSSLPGSPSFCQLVFTRNRQNQVHCFFTAFALASPHD